MRNCVRSLCGNTFLLLGLFFSTLQDAFAYIISALVVCRECEFGRACHGGRFFMVCKFISPKTEKRSRTANTHATHPQIRIPLQRNDHQLKFVRNIEIYIKKTKNSPHSKRAPLKIYEEAKPNPYPIPLTHTHKHNGLFGRLIFI